MDDLDKKILQLLTVGISSYEDLARSCNVTRNTVYRRIAALEKKGIIKNIIRCNVDFGQLEITPVCVSIKLAQADIDKACCLLSAHKNVRLLLRSFGDHNLNLLAFCPKGKEGEIIQSITSILENFSTTCIDISVGFVWEKTDLTSIEDQFTFEEKISGVIEKNIR
ncbi:MAG: Lrp/AsnC family transcriptional regulator [Candidatus Bathyarchaeota archaeon]|nr:Lrp/AsnC family transcriptional regulator [Candidatus Bathyarchaeota archaeon]